MHIQAYSGIFNSDSYNNINLLFSASNLHTIQQNLNRHMFLDHIDINFHARLSLLKYYVIFENSFITE